MIDTAVVGFGCPRSGTTFLYKALDVMLGVFCFKLSEGSVLHPCKSMTGLVDLSKLMGGKKLVLVRIIRDPMEIAESFLAARLPDTGMHALGIARNTDQNIVGLITQESEHVAQQRPMLRERKNTSLIEVRYEELAKVRGREAMLAKLDKFGKVSGVRAELEKWGKDPARVGRLSTGMVGAVSTKDEREYFGKRLAATRKREGYGI